MAAWNHRCIKRSRPQKSRWGCSMPKCNEEKLTHEVAYDYVTGRAGRVSYAEKQVCEIHAQKFCEKYGIDFNNVPVYDVDISQAKRDAFNDPAARKPNLEA